MNKTKLTGHHLYTGYRHNSALSASYCGLICGRNVQIECTIADLKLGRLGGKGGGGGREREEEEESTGGEWLVEPSVHNPEFSVALRPETVRTPREQDGRLDFHTTLQLWPSPLVHPCFASTDTVGTIGLTSTDTVGTIGLTSTDTVGTIDLTSTDTVGTIGLTSTDTVGTIGLTSTDTVGTIGLTSTETVGTIGLTSTETTMTTSFTSTETTRTISFYVHRDHKDY